MCCEFIFNIKKINMENTASDILKKAILFERRGRSFYLKVASQAEDNEVKKIFEIMAEEEKLHEEFLSKQFAHYEKTKQFKENGMKDKEEGDSIAALVLSEDLKNRIAAASFEAAAISAAIDMENKAIELYTQRANESKDENEKKLYEWLADWEKGHHKILNDLNKELTEKIWYDNSFWPF